ncbi:MAG: inositol monophosphatase family protein [Alphaproteobacteria bacterium]
MIRSPIFNVMVKAAQRAGRGLVKDFGEVENLQVSRKGPADFVSSADMNAEKIIREELAKARPHFGFLMEESGASGSTEERWVVDPLDGTTNFLHGVPHWSIAIAVEQKGEITAGLVYNPVRDELFLAEKGGGAYLNNQRLRVSARRNLADSLIVCGTPRPGKGSIAQFQKESAVILSTVAGLRRFGSAALDLAYVAAGRFDGYWERDLAPWDVGAGIILVQEAGGYATDLAGKRNPLSGASILAANPNLHPQLKDVLAKA